MQTIQNIHAKIWGNIIQCTSIDSPHIRAYRRIFVVVYLLIFFPNSLWVAHMPDALFYPPKYSLTAFFSGFPSYSLLLMMHIILLGCLLSVGLGKVKRVMGILAFFVIIIIANFQYSLGKIDHLILLPLALLCFSLTNWESTHDLKKKSLIPIPGETLLAICIAFGMFTAGFQKAFNWIDFDLNYSGFLAWYYPGYLSSGRVYFLASLVPDLPLFMIELLDYTAILFELLPILILLFGKRVYWQFWILIACFFHLANLLLMNIQFHVHCLVYIPFLIPGFLVDKTNRIPDSVYKLVLFSIVGVQLVFLIIVNRPMVPFFIESLPHQLVLSLVLWIITFSLALYGLLERLKIVKANKPIKK